MRARALMVLGTSSHVGKSLLTAAFCRLLADAGVRVAPFKSQNMSLNSAATLEGLEIGRAQALQAEAARVAASVDMNPVLLKPSGKMSSQIVLRGKIWGQLTAAEYHQRRVEELWPAVVESYERLAAANDVIVIEGAGSPAEINLKAHDIVNMRVAAMAAAACVLVGDIDRGGVFAALLGTVELLEPEERALVRGFLVNKFRGDVGLLRPGIDMIERRLGLPCLGVVPHLPDLNLEEEDSVGLPATGMKWPAEDELARRLRVAVVALPSFSNFTDFDSLRSEASVCVLFTQSAAVLAEADVVVLPGSKQTAADLGWLRESGLAAVVVRFAERGLVMGICGGMQMLGLSIADPMGVEGGGVVEGLGLLPLRTEMREAKLTRLVKGRTLRGGAMVGGDVAVSGYEIHVGESWLEAGAEAFARLESVGVEGGGGQPQIPFGNDKQRGGDGFSAGGNAMLDGCVLGRIVGTYLHGIFDGDAFRHSFIEAARGFVGLGPAWGLEDWRRKREESLDRLAAAVGEAVDMRTLMGWVGL